MHVLRIVGFPYESNTVHKALHHSDLHECALDFGIKHVSKHSNPAGWPTASVLVSKNKILVIVLSKAVYEFHKTNVRAWYRLC